jgi:hypothetical protein
MKLICLLTGLFASCSLALGQAGVFVTADEFEKNKPAFVLLCDSGSVKIKPDPLFHGTGIIVQSGKTKYEFDKNKIFGYRDCDRSTFRLVDGNAYQIINTDTFFLYVQKSIRNKSSETEREYYFSTSAGTTLIPLTIQTLQNHFSKNQRFHDILNSQFKNDADLIRLDQGTNRYTLIRLYKESLSQEN